MDSNAFLLIIGIASVAFGLLLLSNDRFVMFISRTVNTSANHKGVKADRNFQGWTGTIVGGFLIALALFSK